MTTFKTLWQKLRESKKYRERFVEAQVKRGIPAQIRALMKQHELSQEELAKRAGLTQGVISRAANPSYGNLTLNTIIRVAAGLDVAFVGRFVPFSELTRYFENFSETAMRAESFIDEDERFNKKPEAVLPQASSTARVAKLYEIKGNPVRMALDASGSGSALYNRENTGQSARYAV